MGSCCEDQTLRYATCIRDVCVYVQQCVSSSDRRPFPFPGGGPQLTGGPATKLAETGGEEVDDDGEDAAGRETEEGGENEEQNDNIPSPAEPPATTALFQHGDVEVKTGEEGEQCILQVSLRTVVSLAL